MQAAMQGAMPVPVPDGLGPPLAPQRGSIVVARAAAEIAAHGAAAARPPAHRWRAFALGARCRWARPGVARRVGGRWQPVGQSWPAAHAPQPPTRHEVAPPPDWLTMGLQASEPRPQRVLRRSFGPARAGSSAPETLAPVGPVPAPAPACSPLRRHPAPPRSRSAGSCGPHCPPPDRSRTRCAPAPG